MTMEATITAPTNNGKLRNWVAEMVALCKPDDVVWANGSQEEYDRLCRMMVDSGTLIRLNPQNVRTPTWRVPTPRTSAGSKTGPSSVRSTKTTPAPTNNWAAPAEMRTTLARLFDGCMAAARCT